MKKIFLLLAILALTSLACSFSFNFDTDEAKRTLKEFGAVETGPLAVTTISEPYPDRNPAELTIAMGGGELSISPSDETALVSGEISTNVSGWEPTVERDERGVQISQKTNSLPMSNGEGVKNQWNLSLGKITPIDLTVKAGAYDGVLELSGVPLESFTLEQGASQSSIFFNTPNPVRMQYLEIKTGASSLDIHGLGNANFDRMVFQGGAGNFTLDFAGQPSDDERVSIENGLGNLTIVIPADRAAEINVEGALKNIDTRGAWTMQNSTYLTEGSEPTLRIDITVGIGNLTLVHEKPGDQS